MRIPSSVDLQVIRVDPSDMEGLRRKVLARRHRLDTGHRHREADSEVGILGRSTSPTGTAASLMPFNHVAKVDSLLERLALRVLPVYRLPTYSLCF